MKKWLTSNYRLIMASPWIATLSIALLTLIIVVFAANNLQREKKHMTQTLLRKGQDVIHLIGAGLRASVLTGSFGEKQLQQLLEQAAADEEIAYIQVADREGIILAHTDLNRIGKEYALPKTLPIQPDNVISKFLDAKDKKERIFEITTVFRLFPKREGRMRMRRHMMMRRMAEAAQNEGTKDFFDSLAENKTFITVGLNTGYLATSIRQNYYQIIIMSVILLLVGLGGWLSLLVAQSFRISQETLENMQAFTSLLISRLPAGIAATDQTGCINTWNKNMEKLTGRTSRQVMGVSAALALPAELADILTDSEAKEEKLDQEVALTDYKGNSRILHASALHVITPQEEKKGSMLLLHDLTHLKDLERQLRRNERLLALGKMAAGVAHEVRNPLSSIKGFATLLGKPFPRDSEEAEAARLMINEVDRLNRSITELLHYAKPLPLHKKNTDLGELVKAGLKLMEGDAKGANVETMLQVGKNLPPVSLDQDRINQVLLNLYLNALQSMEHGGTLLVELAGEKDGQVVSITVTDTGMGIEAKNLERVLDPYFTTKPDGNGLGLALAAKIIEEHGGGISIKSTEGKGTSVKITLPVKQG
jgi:two-component system sensor histidine kinase HydH